MLALTCLGPEVTHITSIHKLLTHSHLMTPTYLKELLGMSACYLVSASSLLHRFFSPLGGWEKSRSSYM